MLQELRIQGHVPAPDATRTIIANPTLPRNCRNLSARPFHSPYAGEEKGFGDTEVTVFR